MKGQEWFFFFFQREGGKEGGGEREIEIERLKNKSIQSKQCLRLWANHLTSLGLSLLICKRGPHFSLVSGSVKLWLWFDNHLLGPLYLEFMIALGKQARKRVKITTYISLGPFCFLSVCPSKLPPIILSLHPSSLYLSIHSHPPSALFIHPPICLPHSSICQSTQLSLCLEF